MRSIVMAALLVFACPVAGGAQQQSFEAKFKSFLDSLRAQQGRPVAEQQVTGTVSEIMSIPGGQSDATIGFFTVGLAWGLILGEGGEGAVATRAKTCFDGWSAKQANAWVRLYWQDHPEVWHKNWQDSIVERVFEWILGRCGEPSGLDAPDSGQRAASNPG